MMSYELLKKNLRKRSEILSACYTVGKTRQTMTATSGCRTNRNKMEFLWRSRSDERVVNVRPVGS